MRIVHIVENLNVGGAEKVMLDLVARQRDAGHECRVICLFQEGEMAPRLTALGIPVIACDKGDGFDLATLRCIRRELVSFRPAVVHSHNVMAHYYAVFAGLGLPGARINTRHGMGDFLGTGKQTLLYGLSLPFTHRVCCVCDAARDRFLEKRALPEKRTLTVYNGIPVGDFARRPQGRLRTALGLPPGSRLLGTVGRLNPAKDHATLIRAFERIADSFAGLHLVVIGEGEQRASLERMIQGSDFAARIHLVGVRHDVAELLPDLELFALSSVTEGFSIALLEAGAAGLPVVATNVGGNREILGAGRGLLVSPGQPDVLARALKEVLDAPERAARMASTLHDWVHENATLDAMYQRYQSLYRTAGAS